MGKAKIKAIIKRPDEKYGHMTNISNTLENLQRTVEGYIEVFRDWRWPFLIICNEEGKIAGHEYNMTLAGEDLVGTIIVVGEDGDEFADCPITFQQWKNIVDFQEP